MARRHLNFLIDALAFAAFLFLASTGVLLRYQLPPGSGGHAGHGSGYGEAQQTTLSLWGWSRHEWGALHYWVACALMAVLVVHLILHWRWIVCVVRGTSTDRSGMRLGLGAFGLCALVLLTIVPWISPVVEQTREEYRNETVQPSSMAPLAEQLLGSMTLEDVAASAEVSAGYLVERLDLPDDVSPTVHVGSLLRSHGMHMNDLRRLVDEIIKSRDETEQKREVVP